MNVFHDVIMSCMLPLILYPPVICHLESQTSSCCIRSSIAVGGYYECVYLKLCDDERMTV